MTLMPLSRLGENRRKRRLGATVVPSMVSLGVS